MVQLRAKEIPGGQLLSLAEKLKAAVDDRAILLVNERVDVAVAASAQGAQLGEAALPVAAARQMMPGGALIGRSVHSARGAAEADWRGSRFSGCRHDVRHRLAPRSDTGRPFPNA